jgi:hypothetical protein
MVNLFTVPVFSLLLVASPTVLAASPPLSPDPAKILQSVTACALQYTQELPDFTCTRITRRRISSRARDIHVGTCAVLFLGVNILT